MHVPIQYIMGALLIAGGVVTTWVAPDLPDEDHPTGERSPHQRFLIRCFGMGITVCGIVLTVAAFLGFCPPPNADGP